MSTTKAAKRAIDAEEAEDSSAKRTSAEPSATSDGDLELTQDVVQAQAQIVALLPPADDQRARGESGPSIDHRARSGPRDDVNEPRHGNGSRRQERAITGDAARDDADTSLGEVRLQRDLVEIVNRARIHRLDHAQLEVEE